jgi:hypothetical protein
VNGFEDAACGGGRHHIIGDAFHLHFRPREARIFA